MKKDHMEVLQAEMLDELKAIHELVTGIRDTVNNQPTRDEFNDLKREVHAVTLGVTDTNRDLKKHTSLPAHVAHGRA